MSPRNLLRTRHEGGHARVTYVELFFDLVFVFAITQLSHSLLAHLDLAGALHTLLLFLAVWWVWIFTSWVTNWLDPDRTPVRLALLVLMLLGLLLSTSIPEAFGEKGLLFAFAYVAMQVGRSLFVLWALGDASPRNTRNFQRITIWLGFSAIFWIAGGLMEGEARLMVWIMALGLEYVAPSLGFRVPDLGRSKTGRLGRRGRASCRALLPVRHHRARRIHPRHRCHLCRGGDQPALHERLPHRLRRHRGACGGSISTSAPNAAPSTSRNQTIPESWRGRPIPIRICWWSPASWCARWPTNWCSPIRSAIWSRRRSPR